MTPLLALLLLACPGGTAGRESGESDSGGEPDSACNDGWETCANGVDDDCDGRVDEAGWMSTGEVPFYADADGDGYASTEATGTTCAADPSAQGTDCDDADAAVNPGATEACDGFDNNCDGEGPPDCEWTGDVDIADATTIRIDPQPYQQLGLAIAGGLDERSGEPLLAVMHLWDGVEVSVLAPTEAASILDTSDGYANYRVELEHEDPWYPVEPSRGCAVLSDLDGDGETDLVAGFEGLGPWNGVERQLFVVHGLLSGDQDLTAPGVAAAAIGHPDGGGLGGACASGGTLLDDDPSFAAREWGVGAHIFAGSVAGPGTASELAAATISARAVGMDTMPVGDFNGDGTDDVALNFETDDGRHSAAVWLGPHAGARTTDEAEVTFEPLEDWEYGLFDNPVDLDGDGGDDLALIVMPTWSGNPSEILWFAAGALGAGEGTDPGDATSTLVAPGGQNWYYLAGRGHDGAHATGLSISLAAWDDVSRNGVWFLSAPLPPAGDVAELGLHIDAQDAGGPVSVDHLHDVGGALAVASKHDDVDEDDLGLGSVRILALNGAY